MIRWGLKQLFRLLWRVRVEGLEHYEAARASGRPLLIIANHVSLLDGPLLHLFIPGSTLFMVSAEQATGWKRWLLKLGRTVEVDFNSPHAARHMIQALRRGQQCMIFPEGRITTTGSLMKVYEGPVRVAERAGAVILPVHIDGAEFSRFSYLDGRHFAWTARRWFPRIRLTILPHRMPESPDGLSARARHDWQARWLLSLMRQMAFEARYRDRSLFSALKERARLPRGRVCVTDVQGTQLNVRRLLVASHALGAVLQRTLGNEKRVGVMLPNVAAMPVTFFALQAYGHVPALLNFTAGQQALRSACRTARLNTVLTSRRFVEAMALEETVEALAQAGQRILYLEDLRMQIRPADRLKALFALFGSLPGEKVSAEEEAAILFTSGSEGAPKGVVLSHRNLLANIEQVSAMLTLLPGETIFNALPTFHSFGLTVGMLWPILKGAHVRLYPSPLHYQVIPEQVYHSNARYMFGTDTFFNGYARRAHPYDFYSIQAFVTGAERLRPETRRLYMDRFAKPIFEGYGVTETAPVLAVNTPLAHRPGTVGPFIPGVEWRLEPVEGIEEGGRLWVRGPNVMMGYLLPDQPGERVPPANGWHDTGDIVRVDEDGFVTILGRAKRFAKIGGEMVSLAAVEQYLGQYAPEGRHVVVAVEHAGKGEQLVLVTDDPMLDRAAVQAAARQAAVSELMIPRRILCVEQIPVLGTGKIDYPAVQRLAASSMGSDQ